VEVAWTRCIPYAGKPCRQSTNTTRNQSLLVPPRQFTSHRGPERIAGGRRSRGVLSRRDRGAPHWRWIQLGAAPVTAGRDPQLEIVLPDSDVVQLVRGAIVAGTSECERLYASSNSKRSSPTFFAMIGSTTSRCRLIFPIRQSSCSSRTTAYPPIPRNTGLPHSPTRSSTYRSAAGD
jgi:hypothetical protein